MSHSLASRSTAVAVTQRSAGRGSRTFTYAGTNPDAVLGAALCAWYSADSWLRSPAKPALSRDEATGVYEAQVSIASAE